MINENDVPTELANTDHPRPDIHSFHRQFVLVIGVFAYHDLSITELDTESWANPEVPEYTCDAETEQELWRRIQRLAGEIPTFFDAEYAWADIAASEFGLPVSPTTIVDHWLAYRIAGVIRRRAARESLRVNDNESRSPIFDQPESLFVTTSDIAEAVWLGNKSIPKKQKDKWPEPRVKSSGRRPAWYEVESIIPVLQKQFERFTEDRVAKLRRLAKPIW